MKRKTALLLAALLTVLNTAGTYAAAGYIENDVLMASVRETYEELGLTVSWDAENETALITGEGLEISIPKYDDSIIVNKNKIKCEPSQRILVSSMYVPAEVIAESLGAELAQNGTIEFDGNTAVIMTEQKGQDVSENKYGGGTPWVDSDIKENIDADVSLKDDFAMAVNANDLLNAEIPDGYMDYSALVMVDMDKKDRINAILTGSGTDKNSELVQSYYSALIDKAGRQEGFEEFKAKLAKIDAISSFEELNAYITNPDEPHVTYFGVGVTPDLDDASRYVLEINPASLILSDSAEYFERTDVGSRRYEACKKLFGKIMVRAGFTQAQADEYFENAIKYDEAAAKYTPTKAEMFMPDYYAGTNNNITLDELDKQCGAYPMKEVLTSLGYADSKIIKNCVPKFTSAMSDIYTEKNFDVLKARMLTKFVINNAANIDLDSLNDYYDAVAEMYGVNAPSLEQNAVSDVINELYEPLTQVYLQKYSSEKTKADITKICNEIIAEYKVMLGEADWLGEETRAKAVEKLDGITLNVAYPEKFHDYSSLELKGKNLWECKEALDKFKKNYNKTLINGKVDKDYWTVNPLETNAYYDPTANSVNILIGILGDPVYSPDMAKEQIYGGIGMIIGHEVSHAFDPTGSKYDKDGNLANWWTDEDRALFDKRTAVLISYYNNIHPYAGKDYNGELVQGEAAADLTSMQCIMRIAAKDENFDYDKFFKAYAKLWQTLSYGEVEEYSIQSDEHPLGYLRINAVVQQFDEFNETYGITEGDGMYLKAEDRMFIW